MQTSIPLSQLVSVRNNPRRVKPERDAHRRLVASIRAHGLIEPLLVRRLDDGGQYMVIAGSRRLAALREVFRGEDPKIACQVRNQGDAEALSLAENFAREPMHPLDEAEAFARLVREEDKDVATVASDFGVPPTYVRQRMKLATLADAVKAAYRQDRIDTGTAEAYAAVPESKQLEVWQELKDQSQRADQVRGIIANAWIDARHALFDITTLPAEKISRDLFGDRVLVERQAFLAAQTDAMNAEHKSLQEEGWSEVVIASQSDVQDRLWRMDEAPVTFDDKVTAKLDKLHEKRQALEAKSDQVEDDQNAADALQEKIDAVDAQEEELTRDAAVHYADPVKATGTAFLILDPDGQVRKAYRIPRVHSAPSKGTGPAEPDKPAAPPAPDDLSDAQKAALYTTQALAVRQLLLHSRLACKRVLVLILHEKVRTEALAICHDSSATNAYVDKTQGFCCPALETLRAKRVELDPFGTESRMDECEAYVRLMTLSETQLDALIELLTAECLTAHLSNPTDLVCLLAKELSLEMRKEWRPDSTWLSSYQKVQLTALLSDLLGPAYGSPADKKKSELVDQAAALFADGAEGRLTDTAVATRVNSWLPAKALQPAREINIPADAVDTGTVAPAEEASSTDGAKKRSKTGKGK